MSIAPRLSVTVLVPTFNREAFLPEALDGVLGQSLPPDEVIVIDDGSTDDIAGVVARYGPKVKYVRQANAGKSTALNRGLTLATGDLVWIFDDDDVPLPDTLQRLYRALEADPEAGFSYGQHDYLVQTPAGWTVQPVDDPNAAGEALNVAVLRQCLVHQPGMLVRRSCYAAVGAFNVELFRSQDYDMLLRLARVFRGRKVEGVTFHQRKHSGPRGPAREQSAARRKPEMWSKYDKLIFERIYREYAIEEFLPLGQASAGANGPDVRLALVTRAAVMARRGLWSHAASDVRAFADRLHASQPGGLTPAEAGNLQTVFDWAGHGLLDIDHSGPFFAALSGLPAQARRSAYAALGRPLVRRLRVAARHGRMDEVGGALKAGGRISAGWLGRGGA